MGILRYPEKLAAPWRFLFVPDPAVVRRSFLHTRLGARLQYIVCTPPIPPRAGSENRTRNPIRIPRRANQQSDTCGMVWIRQRRIGRTHHFDFHFLLIFAKVGSSGFKYRPPVRK